MPVKWEKFKLKRLEYYLNHVGYKEEQFLSAAEQVSKVLSEPCGI